MELAKRFGINPATVHAHLNRAGVPQQWRKLDEAQLSEAASLYGYGWSLKRLGERFGADAETVRQALKRHGVRMRPRNGWASREPSTG